MDANGSLLLILAGILAMAGTHHALVFVRNTAMRTQLWIGCLTLGAAAVALAHALAVPPLPALVTGFALCIGLAVVLASAWQQAGIVARGTLEGQRLQLELAQASRLSIVGELSASIAHEINQPLGAILSNADAAEILLERSQPPLDEIGRILADIRRDGRRASEVIQHVRALVRKREMSWEPVDAGALASDAVALLEPEARRRHITLIVGLPGRRVRFGGDRTLMEQVLVNLVLNAMDATETASTSDGSDPTSRPVLVGIALTAQAQVQFTVEDCGPGIPADRLARLFTSFHTSKAHGMGLGLSMSRSIVEAHGGRISAGNRQPRGARFTVLLPSFREAAAPAPPAGRRTPAAVLHSLRARGPIGAVGPLDAAVAIPSPIQRGAPWP